MTFQYIALCLCIGGVVSAEPPSGGSCQQCEAYGQRYSPNSDFQYADGCRQFNCECHCDGSWECPGERVEEICQDGCDTCLVGGRVRAGNHVFTFTEDCFQYDCFCQCDGSWKCPKEKTKDICNTNVTTGCYFCDVDGKRYQGNSRFAYEKGCIEYQCLCKCDGGWDCPADTAVDRCNTNPDTGCYYCEVDDQQFEGNSYFKHVNGCIEYRCTCNCDGSWSCPGEQAVDLCRQNQTSGCYYCEADDYLYQGGSRFSLLRDCYHYKCTCDCDGGWTCKDSRGVYVCDENGVAPVECKTCNIHGNIFRGKSRFYFEHDCVKYMCTCDCQGRYVCSGKDARITCEGVTRDVIPSLISGGSLGALIDNTRSPRQLNDGNCVNCNVNGVVYITNQDFTMESGCNVFTCRCYCDGQYRCPRDQRRTKPHCRGPSSGGGGSATSTLDTAARGGAGIDVTSRYDSGDSTCIECQHKNVQYDGNTVFSFEDGCWKYRCNCRCNGSFDCPSEDSEYICPGNRRCVQCKVDDRLVEPNTDFTIERDCVTYDLCRCSCDGGWSCGDGIYTCNTCQGCRVGADTFPGNSTFQLTRGCDLYTQCFCACGGEWTCSGEGVQDQCGRCRMCNIGDGYYDGDSQFPAEVGCTRYGDCQCDCDGSWACTAGVYMCDRGDQPVDRECMDCIHEGRRFRPGSSFDYSSGCTQYRRCECKCGETHCVEAEDICGDCRSCSVNGTEYKGGSKFSTKSGCVIYKNCDCYCDGHWECHGDGAIDTCNTCRTCNVDGNTYEPYGRFALSRNCWTYQCFCGCDGATRCPSLTAVNTCTSPDVCRSCDIDNRDIRGNSHFTYDLNGMVMSCRCNCDGSHVCVAEWLYIREDVTISGSGIGGGVGRCLTCNMNGRIYQGNTNYTLSRSGMELDCQCFCNEGYYCYGERTFESPGCRYCSIFGRQHDGDSSFQIVYGGFRLGCTCDCNGDYVCLGSDQRVVVECVAGSGCLPSQCRQCVVDGVAFNGGEIFGTLYQGTTELRCTCGCDGSSFCEGEGGLTISCIGGRCTQVGCGSCMLYGQRYTGNSDFDIIYRGLKLDCQCSCNGDYECRGSTRESVVSCVGGGSGCIGETCQACSVNGRQWAGRSEFRYDYNGIDMRCTCGCDGGYYCVGVSELIEVSCFGGVCNRIGCPSCNVFGQTYTGDSSFEIIYSGTVMRCQCSCGGNYICRGSSGTESVRCTNGGRGCLAATCNSCIDNGQEYAGRSTFRSTYKGVDVMCTCGCDGSRHCTGVTTSIEISCIGRSCSRIGCRECNLFGKDYLGSSQFDIIHQGLKLTCDCDCEGGYICVSSTGVSVVQCVNGIGQNCLRPPCRSCVVDGREYQGTSTFQYLHNGIDMRCTCACDSSYYCEGVVESVELSCVGGRCRPLGCHECRIYGNEYDSVSTFNIIYAGMRLDCHCNCDGSYKCVGQSGTTVVDCANNRGCLPQQCRQCTLDGRNYAGGTKFRYNYNGIAVSCECGCDGSIYCTGISETVTVSCVGGVCTPVGCQSCRVYGDSYSALSPFDVIYSGLKLRCTCDCAGGYSCREPTGTTTVTCRDSRGCLPEECGTCDFDGRQYRGRAVFKHEYKNIDMSCTCGCDGSVFCEGISSEIELRCIAGSCTPMGCQNCDVFGRQYRTLSSFEIIYQGIRLSCDCSCDKSYVCKGSNQRPVIQCLSSGSGCLPSVCRSCVRDGHEYAGESTYTDVYNGIDMSCVCGCDGSSFCTGTKEVLEVSCIGDSCNPIGCRACRIFGTEYATVSDFDIIYEGVRLQCRCKCDASFICRGSSGEAVVECAGGSCHLPTTCRNCVVDGREHRATSVFPYLYKGTDMNCECGCDGTSFCEGITESISISCIGENCSPVGCRSCKLFGQDYSGASQFDVVYRGTKLRCDCNCDTSYRCVGSTVDETIDCAIGRTCLPSRCRKCRVLGQRHAGGTSFQFEWQGYSMSCVCGCDGSYYCRGVKTDIELSCPRRGNCRQVAGCRICDIFGEKYAGGSRKEFVYQGYFMTCTCDCDSSYQCIGVKGDTLITCPAGRDCLQACGTCTADGRQYDGTSVFQTRYNNKEYDCTCGCDGSFFCRCRTADIQLSCKRENQCEQIGCNTCLSDGIERAAESEFEKMYDDIRMDCFCNCDGSYRCQGRSVTIVVTCTGEHCNLVGCRSCIVDGKEFQSGEQYETTDRRGVQRCECKCDGSSSCSIKEPVRPACNTCVIDDETYDGHTQFRHYRGGESYICICKCDGTHNCYLESCPSGDCRPQRQRCHDCEIFGSNYDGGTQFSIVNRGNEYECSCYCNGTWKCVSDLFTWSCEGTGCRPTQCQPCLIEGRRHEGDSRFTGLVEGRHMNCHCKCDASYRCVGGNYVCTERGCETTCRDCVINGVSYTGNFQTEMQSTRMQCSCDCNGNYRCDGDNLRCTSERGCVSTCQSCIVDGISYTGTFVTNMQGTRMQCSCDCNGRYVCQGGDWRCTSEQGCVRKCQECAIENRQYAGNTQFSAVIQNIRMNCDCNCNGNYRCEGGNLVCTSGRGCVSTCQQCSIDGRPLEGNSQSTMSVFGKVMDCSCDCNGRYNCRSETQTCSSATGCIQSCRRCNVNSREYAGDSTFQTTLKGILMDCSCDCSGAYTCHGGTYVCTTLRGCVDSCRGCTIEGTSYGGNSTFEIFYRGYGIRMTCDCSCGGSYTCKGVTEQTTCVGEGCANTNQCRDCVVQGQTYAGNTQFETVLDGIPMQCQCHCTGGYKCKGKTTTTTCTGPGCSASTDQCQSCTIGGNTYPGRSKFQVDRAGIRMNCTCRCDGSYRCKGEKTTTTCVGPGCGNTCGPCNVDGRRVEGNTRFETVRDGATLQCTCRCDGSYSCEGTQTTQVCRGPGCTTTGCRRCVIDERPYTGNTRFTIRKSNLEYHCTCFCDGSYTCESDQGITSSCVGASCAADSCRNCRIDGAEYELDARFRLSKNQLLMNCVCECDGAYRCFSISGTCTGSSCDEYGCRSCTIDGRQYKGNAQYEIQRGRESLICTCDCSGEYQCRTTSLQVECVGSSCGVGEGACKRCNVDGKRYTGNTRFVITKYGLHMQCACNCDSSYTCRGYQIIVDPSGASEYTDVCKQCDINGQRYNGNTRFQAMIENVRSICSCACDGTYSCHGSTTTCRRCVIGGVRYETNSDFTLTRNGNSISCHCGCNGDFVCEGSQQCTGSECGGNIGGCRECIIFGTRYRGDSRFTTESGGIRMLCECSCNGAYSCKGYRSVTSVVLPSEQRTACATCLVAGEQRDGNSQFTIRRGCFEVDCVCDCDGRWECPQQVPQYACVGTAASTHEQYRYSIAGSLVYATDDVGSVSRTVITDVDQPSTGYGSGQCRSCDVNGQDYPGGTAFMLQDGCLRFTCRCDCNGGWNCTSVQGSDCSGGSDPFGQGECVDCLAFGRRYSPNRRFEATDECYRYDCMCECDGSWECPRELTVRTCTKETSPYDERKGVCRQCVVGGQSHDYGTTFEFIDDCVQYRCKCKCDGSYDCPANAAVRVCRSGSGASGRLAGTGSNTPSRTGSSSVSIRQPGGSSSSSSSYSSSSTDSSSSSSRGTTGLSVGGSSVGVRRGSSGGSWSSSRTSGTTRDNGYRTSPIGGGQAGGGGAGSVDLSSVLTSGGACRDCDVNGDILKGGRDFTFRAGCIEYLCECFCNGTYVCPPDKSTRFCGRESTAESPSVGCTVGNRTYKTNLFSYTENCIKYVCHCYNNGAYNCDSNKSRRVC